MSFPRRRLADKVAIDELKDGWGGTTKGLGPGEKNGFLYRQRQQHKIHYIPKQWWQEKRPTPFQRGQCPQGLSEWGFQLARLEQITSEVASLIDKTDRDSPRRTRWTHKHTGRHTHTHADRGLSCLQLQMQTRGC